MSETSKHRDTEPILAWPMGRIPVEIFEIISSYLTRAEIKTLRLVCKEFDIKVSGLYFRNVVVPFRSEIYSKLGRDENGMHLFANGMRIFESFGPHILRFALSLELDEDDLAFPPVKPVQEAVPAFWGLYRWPHESYHRYTDLEGLEQTADETEGMKEALRCLSKVTNLGLCCDAGLGFLVGPDQLVRKSAARHPVFDTQDWREDQRASKKNNPVITVADFNHVHRTLYATPLSHVEAFKRRILDKMVSDAGFTASQVDAAIDLLLTTEGTTLRDIEFNERSSNLSERRQPPGEAADATDIEPEPKLEFRSHPLIPGHLTRAQKELLLELEWAHRAMIQSYVIGIIDNAAEGCFNHLTTLTIAKIPSAHVHILCRKELWKSIPSLRNVSLGVIADWRKVSKPPPGYVEDTPVSPVEAVGKVYRLLNDHIGKQRNIESIRFEWICGGEFAPSAYQRNQHILPAPFFESPTLMVLPGSAKDETDSLLSLPHIKHLSLKNCWVSPHVLLQTIRRMALSSLEKLELESVSLSGPPCTVPQPGLQHVFAQNLVALGGNGPQLVNPLAPQPPQVAQQPFIERPPYPETLTWAGLIDHFSPGVKIRKQMATASQSFDGPAPSWEDASESLFKFLPNVDRLRSDEKKYWLKHISFKSCGYVGIDVPYLNTRAILPPQDAPMGYIGYFNNYRQEFFNLMQHCRDNLLGRIVPFIAAHELVFLEHAFQMDLGWEGAYDEQVVEDAMADGVEYPGTGRFSGVVETGISTDLWRMDLDDPSDIDPP